MSKPRLLDLCCAAGGAAEGYSRAGFEVVGVDIRPQPNYPFEFRRADVLELPFHQLAREFDVIHASPPCQRYIRGGLQGKNHPDLLGPIRDRLIDAGATYVIENVPGAPMRADVILCGSMFGLPIRRHRWFESSLPLPPFTLSCNHSSPVVGVYGNPHGKAGAWPGMLPGTSEMWRTAMGIDWMTPREIALAIPPVYTEWIGKHLLHEMQEYKRQFLARQLEKSGLLNLKPRTA